MKDFKKFLEEISIKGNRGIPGEFDKRRGDKEYLRDVSNRAKNRLGVGEEGGRQMGETGQRLMELVGQSMQLTRGKEKELEELAEEIIRLNYESILYGVELDIKLVVPGEVRDFMDEEGEPEMPEMPEYKEIKDDEIKKEVDKAKIINNIVQGEAKNTKHMLHLPEVKEGLDRIFTRRGDSDRIFRMWNEITNLADKMDWLVPIRVKSQMIEQQPEGMAGAVKVDWSPKEFKEKEEKEYKEPEQDQEQELEEYKELPDNAVVIKARGVDFPMLLHETVKGIYQLIGALNLPDEDATPEDIRKAMIVKLNTESALDEAEEFRYGPEIAADLRDFINLNANIQKYPNLREKVFGEMTKRGKLETDWFLNLMKGILSNTQEARVEIDKLIAIVVKAADEYTDALSKWEMGEILGHGNGEYDDKGDVGYADDKKVEPQKEEDPEEIDYSKMREKDLVDAMNAALDEKDYKKAHYINSFMKHESKVIFSKELEIINENKNPHIK